MWMQHVDERVLEHLGDRVWSDAELMASDMDASAAHIAERCRIMARLGYVEPTRDDVDAEDATMWELGYWGREYLEGGVDAELIPPSPAPRPPEAVRPRSWTGLG